MKITSTRMIKIARRRKFLIVFLALFLILSPFAYLKMSGRVGSAEAAWYDDSFQYRQSFTVTNSSGSTLSNYQISFTIDTTNTSKFKSDCSDIRVTDASGKLLPYWIEPTTCNTSATKIWTKIIAAPQGTSYIYIYYGNTAASSVITTPSNIFVREISNLEGFWDYSITASYPGSGNTWYDLSGNGRNFTNNSTATWSATNGFTISGSNYFNGPSSSVFPQGNNPRTVVAIANPSSTPSAYNHVFHYGSTNQYQSFGITARSSGAISSHTWSSGCELGSWTGGSDNQIAVTGTGSTQEVFKNGSSLGTCSTYALNTAGGNASQIGARISPAETWVGTIKNVQIYSRVLTSGEISDLANNRAYATTTYAGKTLVRKTTNTEPTVAATSVGEEKAVGPIAYWKFDEGAGATAKNSVWQITGTVTNLVRNPSFEYDAAGTVTPSQWTVGDWSSNAIPIGSTPSQVTTEDKLFGGVSYKLANISNSAEAFHFYPTGGLIGNTTYTWSAWVKSASGSITVNMYYYTGKNQVFSVNASEGWKKISLTFTTASTPEQSDVELANQTYSSTLYVDGAQLEVASASTMYCDGSLLGNGKHAWSGTTDASTSTCDTGTDGEINGANWASEDQCISGKCLSFNANGQVDLGSNAIYKFTGSSFTISLWTKLTTTTGTKNLITKLDTWNDTGYGIRVGDAWGGGVKVNAYAFANNTAGFNSSEDIYIISNTAITPGTFYHIEFVYDYTNKQGNLYINGKLDSSQTKTVNYAPANANLTISAGNSYIGSIDDVRLYPFARTAAQVQADYTSGKSGIASTKGTSVVMGAQSTKQGGFLTDGLVGYWKMDEASGATVADASGNGNTGTATNASTVVGGKYGNGRSFNGSSDYTSTNLDAQPSALPTTTWSAWVYPTRTGYGSRQQFMCTDNGGYDRCILIEANTANYGIFTGSGVWQPAAVILNQWQHIAVVFSSTNIEFYLNGTRYSYGSAPSGQATTNKFTIGRNANGGENFQGNMDEVRVYNRTLSPAEVTSLYNWAPGPVAQYSFDEGNGTTVTDSSGNGYNGIWGGTGSHWTQGKYGKAGNFNGSDDYTSVGNFGSIPNTGTISFWMYPSVVEDHRNAFTTAPLTGSTSGNRGFRFEEHATYATYGGFGVLIGNDSADSTTGFTNHYYYPVGSPLPPKTWYHVVVVWDKTNNVVVGYLNGVQKFNETNTTWPTNMANVVLGAGFNTSRYWKGQIDDVRIYNYARSQKQVVEDMNGGHPAGGSPVGSQRLYWKLDEGTGTSTHNSGNSGSTLDGTISNATWSNDAKYGKSLLFNGSNSIVSTSNNLGASGKEISVSFWFKTAPVSSFSPKVVAELSTNSNNNDAFMITYNDNSGGTPPVMGTFNISMHSAAGYSILSTNTRYDDNKWHHLVAVYNRNQPTYQTQTTLYIDGVTIPLSAIGGYSNVHTTNFGDYPFFIGDRSGSTTLGFNGNLDEVKVYNYALNKTDVAIDYSHNAAMVLGSYSTESNGTTNSLSQSRLYCVPGDTSTCNPPVGEWNFTEGNSTTVGDTSGSGNNGTFQGTAPYWANGQNQKAGSFNGNNFVSLTSTNFSYTTATLGVWVSSASTPSSDRFIFMGSKDPNRIYITQLATTGNVGVRLGSTVIDSGVVLPLNKWNYISLVINNGTYYLYLNGKQISTNTYTGLSGLSSCVAIGAYSGDCSTSQNSYFVGKIYGLRVYNYVRSPAQIAWDYNRGGPVGWWKLNECQGTTAYDASGNGNIGTITIGSTVPQSQAGTCTDGLSTSAWYNGRVGKFGSSLNLDGQDDYVQITNFAAAFDSGTISFWIKPNWNGNDNTAHILIDHTGGWPLWVGKNNSNQLYFFWNFNNSKGLGAYFDVSSTITSGNWYHIVARWNGNALLENGHYADLKVNVTKAATNFRDDTGSKTYPSGNMYFGKQDKSSWNGEMGTSGNYNGQIDDVRVYNYPLTIYQIQQLYNEGSAVRYGPSTGSP